MTSRPDGVGPATAKLATAVSGIATARERIMAQDIANEYLPGVASRSIKADLDSLSQIGAKCLELGEAPDQAFHLAVLGEAGVGTSSRINALFRCANALVDRVEPTRFVCSYTAVTSVDLEGATIQYRDGRREEQSITVARRLLDNGSADEDLLSTIDQVELRLHAKMKSPLSLWSLRENIRNYLLPSESLTSRRASGDGSGPGGLCRGSRRQSPGCPSPAASPR